MSKAKEAWEELNYILPEDDNIDELYYNEINNIIEPEELEDERKSNIKRN